MLLVGIRISQLLFDSVRSESTSDAYFHGHEPIDERYPKYTRDASFPRADSQYPLVIETSYSQKYKDLARLADEYICGSDGNIGVVLGLDIEYRVGSKRASVSIWRPKFAPDPQNKEDMILEMVGVQEANPFCADDGTIVQGRGLSLQLCNFGPRTGFANVPPETQSMTIVQITCDHLPSFLLDAETRHKIKRARRGV
ncbi:hypothetical protein N7G274_007440 [Stereocaulon virgatum]|uniref:Uncharacterized protein n=1 Tax=Stereocaulon virgatum TaxID=373712 RepID=A0ABR4A6N3_9LECA